MIVRSLNYCALLLIVIVVVSFVFSRGTISAVEDVAENANQPPRVVLTVDDRERDYFYYLPKNANRIRPAAGWPVVLAFHGGGTNARNMMEFCELNTTAEKHGFAVVYPNGSGRVDQARTWNGGNCCGYALKQNIDDVAFVRTLLDDLPKYFPIDCRRVYATGMSNGAVMSYRIADALADRIAAIAPVAGPMGTREINPARPVPVCHFHGTRDDFARFEGGVGPKSLSRTNFISIPETIALWRKANRCESEGIETVLPQKVDDGTRVVRTEYQPAAGGAPIVLYKIEAGGHTWPGHPSRFRFLGTTTGNLDANEVMWAFFQEHALPE